MPVSKNALIRYQTIDTCLQKKTKFYGIKELKKACENALSTYKTGDSVVISVRQIEKDIEHLRDEFGYNAPIEKYADPSDKRIKYYRYLDPNFSIWKQILKPDEKEALNEAIQSLLAFEGRPEVEWIHELIGRIQSDTQNKPAQTVIAYDDNPDAVGLEHIHPLFKAIMKKTPLKITYKPFDKPEVLHFICPYLLKEYNNRWFVLCKSNHFEHFTCLALDRIQEIESTSQYTYLPYPEDENPKEFFDNFIGVTWEKNETETILLNIKKSRSFYVQTKPIHQSQKHKALPDNPEWDEIRLNLIPNKEFYSQMLFFGDDIKIISPPDVKNKMRVIVKNMHQHYQD